MPSGFCKGDKLGVEKGGVNENFGIKNNDGFGRFVSCLEDSRLLDVLTGLDDEPWFVNETILSKVKDLSPWEMWQWQE